MCLLHSFREKGNQHDLIGLSGGRKIPLHRVVVCLQSEVIAAACRFNQNKAVLDVAGQEANNQDDAPKGSMTFDFLDTDPDLVDILIHYLYNFDYPSSTVNSPTGDNGNSLLLYVRMYAVAQKYGVPGLQKCTQARFKAAVKGDWPVEHLIAAIEKAYGPDLLEDDRAIKDHILDLFWQKQDLLDRDGVKSLVFNTKAVAAELLLHFHQRKKTQSPAFW